MIRDPGNLRSCSHGLERINGVDMRTPNDEYEENTANLLGGTTCPVLDNKVGTLVDLCKGFNFPEILRRMSSVKCPLREQIN
jgi:hypothetical protein